MIIDVISLLCFVFIVQISKPATSPPGMLPQGQRFCLDLTQNLLSEGYSQQVRTMMHLQQDTPQPKA